MENIFIYLCICIYNHMYTFVGAQQSKIIKTEQVEKSKWKAYVVLIHKGNNNELKS